MSQRVHFSLLFQHTLCFARCFVFPHCPTWLSHFFKDFNSYRVFLSNARVDSLMVSSCTQRLDIRNRVSLPQSHQSGPPNLSVTTIVNTDAVDFGEVPATLFFCAPLVLRDVHDQSILISHAPVRPLPVSTDSTTDIQVGKILEKTDRIERLRSDSGVEIKFSPVAFSVLIKNGLF